MANARESEQAMNKRAARAGGKRRGRPAIGPGVSILLTLRPEDVALLDQWRKQNDLSRQAAIRKLISLGLEKSITKRIKHQS